MTNMGPMQPELPQTLLTLEEKDYREELFLLGEQRLQNAPQHFLDLDVEADGKPGYGSLLSIGCVSPWGDTFYRELKPTSSVWIDSMKRFCEDHNLKRERLLDEGMEPAEALGELFDWQGDIKRRQGKLKTVVVAFNAGFDYPWIDLEAIKAGMPKEIGVAGYCIKSLAMALSENYDWRDTQKAMLPKIIVPDGELTHNALEDAVYQQKLHFGLAALLYKTRASRTV